MSKGEINDTVVDFVTNHTAQPAKNYGLVKTHKPGCKFRVITAGSNSATIHLSAFTETFLGPLARSQEHILVDTTDFLNFVNLLNTRYAPMPKEVLLVSWDIEAMYPSTDNKLGLEACRDSLNTRSEMKPSRECILEAIKITLECNNSIFNGKHYLQIDGTAMGPKNACSYADISVSNIDKKVFCRDDIKPLCWGRYRDDIFSLWNQSVEKLMEFTNYLSSICPTIKFTVRFDHQKLEFLDVLVYKDKGALHTTAFSKETDGHMYLLPSSAQFHSVSRNIPYNVALRLRRICSTQEQFDNKCEEYKGYLLARGYNRVHLHKQFSRAKRVPRESTLIKRR